MISTLLVNKKDNNKQTQQLTNNNSKLVNSTYPWDRSKSGAIGRDVLFRMCYLEALMNE
jgi:hypothetical protein